jgi:1-carboxybiuret hydrolase
VSAAQAALAGDATSIAEAVRAGTLSASAVTEAVLDRIARLNPLLNAFTDVTADRARADAAALDARLAAGEMVGPLAGIPVAVKNLLDVRGLPTRAGSKINRERPPATSDAALLQHLSRAGAILVGGLNMGEYAYDFTGENAHDGACRNPHDPARMTGGSSSGCGAATAAGLAPLSLGSDTNGSIRVPSSLCGIFGLKPTYGRLTRHGSFPFCDSLDHLGPFARSVRDLALTYDVLQGPAEGDHACAGRAVEPTLAGLSAGADGLRVAVAGGYFARGGLPEARDAVARAAAALGVERVVDLPSAALGRAAAYIITNAESSAFHLERLRTRADDFDPDTRDRFLAGALLPASWYIQAQRVRRWHHDQVLALFQEVDVLLAPATPCSAPLVGQKTMVLDGVELPVRPHMGLFTQPISCIGLPVCAVPMVLPGAMPIGVQVIAAPWREDHCLRVAAELERRGVARAPLADPTLS